VLCNSSPIHFSNTVDSRLDEVGEISLQRAFVIANDWPINPFGIEIRMDGEAREHGYIEISGHRLTTTRSKYVMTVSAGGTPEGIHVLNDA
jgi:hypothetical protein